MGCVRGRERDGSLKVMWSSSYYCVETATTKEMCLGDWKLLEGSLARESRIEASESERQWLCIVTIVSHYPNRFSIVPRTKENTD